MNPIYIKVAETALVMVVYVICRVLLFGFIHKAFLERSLHESREVLLRRLAHIILLIITVSLLFLIWGVDQSQLAVAVGSVLTLLGVAFFAQWSILSNITSSIILFFRHPAKLGDQIAIMEGKDYIIEGTIENIGMFFTTILTLDGSEMTLPNNVFILKNIKKLKATTQIDENIIS